MLFQRLISFRTFRAPHSFCTMLLLSVMLSATAQTNSGNWSGTITSIYTRTTHHAAPYSETIYEKWDKHYEQRMEAKVTNGTGTASSNILKSDTSLNREQTGSRTVEQWDIETGTAAGTGNTEISINIDQQHKTYTIEVPIPETTGNQTKTFYCKGCGQAPADPVTSGLGEDETAIEVEDEKLGANPNVLSGEKTEHKTADNGETEEVTITRWTFTRGKN